MAGRGGSAGGRGWRFWALVGGGVLIAFAAWASWNVMSNVEERERTEDRWSRGIYTDKEIEEFNKINRRR